MFDAKRYPPNWRSEIRPRILAREGHCCKFCGIADKQVGWWVPGGKFYTADDYLRKRVEDGDLKGLLGQIARAPNGRRVTLTTAHLDSALVDHDDSNLAALCQRCHLNHDREATSAKRAEGKRYGKRRKQLQFQF